MHGMLLATVGEALAGGFGAVAALLLVGGSVWLRGQRERLRFQLARAALDKGMPPPLASGLPAWLASLRRAVMVCAVGIGLAGAGGRVIAFAKDVPIPSAAAVAEDAARPVPAPEPPESFGGPRLPPPRPSPAIERWHRAQDEQAVGLTAVGTGTVLILLGLVRIVFAVVERKYEPAARELALRGEEARA